MKSFFVLRSTELDSSLLLQFLDPDNDPTASALFGLPVTVVTESDALNPDPALTPELKQAFTLSRLQFNTQQELPKNQEDITPAYIEGVKTQVRTQVAEHALAQPVMILSHLNLEADGLHFSGQKTEKPFLRELFERRDPGNIFTKLEPYWDKRYQVRPSPDQLMQISQDPLAFSHLVSDEVWYTTQLGLEFAETVGIIRLQNILASLQAGEIAVEFSAGSPSLRPTPVIHNWLRIYELQPSTDGKRHIKTTYIKTFHPFSEFSAFHQIFSPALFNPPTVQDIISQPVKIGWNKDTFLQFMEIKTQPEFMALYDRVLESESITSQIENIALMIVDKQPIEVIQKAREQLERDAIRMHKQLTAAYLKDKEVSVVERSQIRKFQQLYGAGGGCGMMASVMNEPGSSEEPQCPLCHHPILPGAGNICRGCGRDKWTIASLMGQPVC